MQVENRAVSELIPYENNPRINDEAVEYVANSIREFGFKNPIIVDKNDVIIAGHTRLKAAIELGLETVPTIKVTDLTDEQVRAYRLADNKVAEKAEWDLDLLDIELDSLDFDMGDFGFTDDSYIDWDDVENLSERTYDEPQHEMLECPQCHHVDMKVHFRKVKGVEEEFKTDEE